MTIDKEMFPEGCDLAFQKNGSLTGLGNAIMLQQRQNEWQGLGAEHPCYGCSKQECKTRAIEYHDKDRKYIIQPRFPTMYIEKLG